MNSTQPRRDWIQFVKEGEENMNGMEIVKKMQSGEMFSYFETISPEKATDMLALMPRNRKITQSKVKNYALLMKQGMWDENHPQGLIFNKDGKLIDGQHRLHGVIESKVTVKFYCTFNADESCVLNLDNGMSRSVDQTGQIMGLDTDKISIAIARCLFIQVGKGVAIRNIEGHRVLAMYQSYQKSIDFAKRKKSNSAIVFAPIRAVIARAHYQAITNPEHSAFGKVQELERFIEILDTGFSRTEADFPAIALRNAYVNHKARSASSAKVKMLFTCRSINAIDKFLAKSSSKTILEAKLQLFPIPEDEQQ